MNSIIRPKAVEEEIFLLTKEDEYVGRAVVPVSNGKLPDLVSYGTRIFKRQTVNGYNEIEIIDVESSLME